MNSSYVGHDLRLIFLAPDIVEAILDGRQPPAMQLQPLIRKRVPVEWERQRVASFNANLQEARLAAHRLVFRGSSH